MTDLEAAISINEEYRCAQGVVLSVLAGIYVREHFMSLF